MRVEADARQAISAADRTPAGATAAAHGIRPEALAGARPADECSIIELCNFIRNGSDEVVIESRVVILDDIDGARWRHRAGLRYRQDGEYRPRGGSLRVECRRVAVDHRCTGHPACDKGANIGRS